MKSFLYSLVGTLMGTTPYTGLTSGKSAVCFVPVGGLWYCGSIS